MWLALVAAVAAADPCAAAAYRGFDPWIGQWSVHSAEPGAASSSIERLGAGCAVLESYRQGDGYSGTSLNYRDPGTGEWRQVWIDSRGSLSEFHGTAGAAGIDFAGFTRRASGGRALRRMSVTREGARNVRQRSLVSLDDGASWQDHYSLQYRPDRHPSLAGPCEAPPAPAAESAARAVVDALVAADNAASLEGVLAAYAPDAVLLPPGEAPVGGAVAIRSRYERLFAAWRPALEGHVESTCVAGPVALVEGRSGGRMRGKAPGGERPVDDVYWAILRETDGAWRISVLAWRPRRPASPTRG